MEYSDLLDDYDNKENQLWNAITWWESRRLRFNMIVGGLGMIVLLLSLGSTTFYGATFFIAFWYGLGSNIAYLAGWVLEILLYYYFSIAMKETMRTALFGLGTCVALFPVLLALVILLVG